MLIWLKNGTTKNNYRPSTMNLFEGEFFSIMTVPPIFVLNSPDGDLAGVRIQIENLHSSPTNFVDISIDTLESGIKTVGKKYDFLITTFEKVTMQTPSFLMRPLDDILVSEAEWTSGLTYPDISTMPVTILKIMWAIKNRWNIDLIREG
jgi:hypothetical protein